MTVAEVEIIPTLEACEEIIARGIDAFAEVGTALKIVRDNKLYREANYTTFEAYCAERWSFSRSYGRRLVNSATVADVLTPIGRQNVLPMNERQTRALSPLLGEPESLRDAWSEVQARAQKAGTKVTHKLVEEVVADVLARLQETCDKGAATDLRPFKARARVAEREAQLRELAASGHTSRQIAEELGVTPETARMMAKRLGAVIAADAAVGRVHQPESNRVVSVTVQGLEGYCMGLALVDFDALDRAEIPTWVESLTESIRKLSELKRRLKECQ